MTTKFTITTAILMKHIKAGKKSNYITDKSTHKDTVNGAGNITTRKRGETKVAEHTVYYQIVYLLPTPLTLLGRL